MAWEYEKSQIRQDKFDYAFGDTTVPGVRTVEFSVKGMSMPLGFIWYRWAVGKGELDIVYIWVHEDVRRAGLATKMLSKVLEIWPSIVLVQTGKCNALSKPWALKNGFKFNERRSCWEKKIIKKLPKKSR